MLKIIYSSCYLLSWGSKQKEENMGFVYITFITSMFISLYISMVDAQGKRELYFMEYNDESRQNRIGGVSGEDENEEKGALVLEKFRVLLGLKSFHKTKPITGTLGCCGSPSPSPSLTTIDVEAPAPAPALVPVPVPPIHSHFHRRSPHLSRTLPLHKLQKHDKEKDRRKGILLAAIVTTGATLTICGIGLIWVGRKYYKNRKRSTRTGFVHRNGGSSDRSKDAASQNLANKVRHDPGFDMFYLETLTNVLDPQACVKETSNCLNTCSIQNLSSCTLFEKKDLVHEPTELVARERSCSSAEEIISVHEYAESIKYDSDGHNSANDDKIAKIESHSSDGGSFHSICNSLSCSIRLSNASTESLTETIHGFSPKRSDTTPNPPSHPQNLCRATASNSALSYKPPPPPPPPPPPLHANSSCSTPSQCKSSRPPTLLNMSPQRNSDSTSGENQASANDLPLPPKVPERPKPPSSIPPPPCPPPPSPPPLPTGKNDSLTPLGKDGAPLPKLKPLHWDKVRAAPDHSMVWDKLRSSSFELDEEMIESLFGYNLKTAFGNDEGKSKTPSPNKHVLEPKRLQNITILSKALNVSADQVCNALKQGDGLSLQQLEALVKMAPTKEEEAKLSNYKGDTNELGTAEKLVRTMLNITFAFQRVEAMLYRATFEDEVVHLRNSFSTLEEACKELRSSRLFLKLLEAVLKTGNRMNVGTIRGGARAFKLDALLKLADVKGTDGKTTLLHFVVQEILRVEGIRMSESIIGKINQKNKSRTVEEKEDDYRRMGLELVSGLSAELCNVKKTASIDLDVLASSVSNLSNGMSKLGRLVQTDLCKDATSSNFVRAVKTFMSNAEKNLKELQNHEDKVLQSVREITEYFHGNVSKDEVNPLRIFVIVRDFLGMLDQVCREIRSSKTPRSPNPLAQFR